MRKALIVTTVVATVGSFNRENIKALKSLGYEVTVATHFVEGGNWDNSRAQRYREELVENGEKTVDICFSRFPFSMLNIRAYKNMKELITRGKYTIIHCQTPIAAAITRLACRKLPKEETRVIYTAHGFHFFKGAPLKNWLIYFPIEWLCSFWTDTLITINHEDYERAKKRLHAKKTVYVPGVGIDVQRFQNTVVDRAEKRREIGVPKDCVLRLSVGELNRNKNHETAIRALAQLPQTDVHYAIAGSGPLEEHLAAVAEKLGVANRVHILGFRPDIAELYKAADVFVHPSFREGLPVALMEAMASGLPCVVSKIRGNVDLIDEQGGAFFEPNSAQGCKEAMSMLGNCGKRTTLGKYNVKKTQKYDFSAICEQMKALYGEALQYE